MGTISLDGEQLSNDEIGFNIVVLDYPSFKLSKVKTFDTNTDSAKSQKLASFLMSLQETSIILVAVKGDIAGAVGQDVWDTLVSRKLTADFQLCFTISSCRKSDTGMSRLLPSNSVSYRLITREMMTAGPCLHDIAQICA